MKTTGHIGRRAKLIPDGQYRGEWLEDVVVIKVGRWLRLVFTDESTPAKVPCIVRVSGGRIEVEAE